MIPALSLAQSAHDDESSLVSTAQRIRELEDTLLVSRAAATDAELLVLRLSQALEQAAAIAQAGLPRDSRPVSNGAAAGVLTAIHAVCQAALESFDV